MVFSAPQFPAVKVTVIILYPAHLSIVSLASSHGTHADGLLRVYDP